MITDDQLVTMYRSNATARQTYLDTIAEYHDHGEDAPPYLHGLVQLNNAAMADIADELDARGFDNAPDQCGNCGRYYLPLENHDSSCEAKIENRRAADTIDESEIPF